MTKDEFAAIKGREKVATPKSWAWHKGDSCNAYPMVYTGEHEFPVLDIGTEDYPGRDEDAEFVAHAREDIPNLIAEVERLNEIVDIRCPTCKGLGTVQWLNEVGIAIETGTCPDCHGVGMKKTK